ncbi:hypothetical protein C8T65DRAFT_592473 [Cerioporus squamosus]|nr:hypothetical protein C8T65DRAFT_592473 [Cerioporus squamosus]
MDSLTIDVADAVISAHEKQAEVRTACLVYDQAMLDLRADYFLDADPASWPEGLAARLELLNKERRKQRRTDLRSAQTALRKLHAEVNSDLMHELNAQVAAAFERCARFQVLFQTFDDLYDARVKSRTIAPQDRVSLRRARPRMQKGLYEAKKLRDTIRCITSEWWPYVEVLMSEVELKTFLKTMRDMKIPFRLFLEKTTPVCEELAKLYATRDTIVQDVIKTTFRLETSWLALDQRPLFGYRYRHEMKIYDSLLAQAKAQRPSHDAALLAVRKLDAWASSPAVVPGPRGIDICIDRLFEADEKVRELHRAINAMTKVSMKLTSRRLY